MFKDDSMETFLLRIYYLFPYVCYLTVLCAKDESFDER